MESRKFDLIVFGASGFTGQYTVDEVARVAEEENLTWAVAGRSLQKVQAVLAEASARTGKNLNTIPIIIADTDNPSSLKKMAEQGRVVLNCVGPYKFYGEPVVKACIEAGTHHLDISGEPTASCMGDIFSDDPMLCKEPKGEKDNDFLEKMQLLYNTKAKAKNVFVIGSTGFDSIPAEMGLLYTRNQFQNGELTNLESYLTGHGGSDGFTLNTGTFESVVNGIASMSELKPLRKSLFPERLPKYQYRLPKRRPIFYSKEVNKWCVAFPGSDKSVVYRTVRDLLATGRLKKPIEFNPYFCVDSFLQMMGLLVFVSILALFSSFSFGRWLLLKYPHIFSVGYFRKGGPNKKQIDACSFSMTFIGYGYNKPATNRTDKTPNRTIVTRVTGPEPAYVATPICMIQSGVTLLKEQEKIPHKGGVLTPGAAFWNTDLIARLQNHNIKFSTVSSNSSISNT